MSPLKLLLKAVANSALIWAMHTLLPQYVTVSGGLAAFVIIGSLLTLLNLFLRPILAIVSFPFRLLFTLFTTILVNGFFLWVVYTIVLRMDPGVVVLAISGGAMGWVVVSTILGAMNWVMKHF